MPVEFHFLRPEWLLALPLVALISWGLGHRRLAPGSWQRVVDPALLPHVLSSSLRRAGSGRWWLLFLGGVVAVTALAGPAWQRVEQPVFRSSQSLVVALDLSRSMDAQDVAPSRLIRARLKILDLLERRASGQTALVVYSANAFTVTPLTTDADTVAALVNSLSTDIMPSRGSYPAVAIDKSRQLLEQAGVRDGEVVLITDGAVGRPALEAAERIAAAGYRLSVLGVGTLEGAPIPKAGGGFVTDRNGQMAVPRLEPDGLAELAAAGNGRFAILAADDSDLDYLLREPGTAEGDAGGDDLATDQWRDEGPWLVLLLLPIAALAFRRGYVFVLAGLLLPLPQDAQAFSWDDLWRTPDQQARALLEEGAAAEAAARFEDPAWRAVAQYRAGRFAESAAGFASGEDATAHYNRGNALARMGQLEAALEAYDAALELDPTHEDAEYNRDLVQGLLDAQDSQGEQSQESGGEGGGEAQQSEGDAQSQESGEQGNAGNPGEESEGESDREQQDLSEEDLAALQEELERAAQEAAEKGEAQEPQDGDAQSDAAAMRRQQEQQQAMEQWLRRIPNDPGGLLRRKFRYQYQRQGRDQDGNTLWPDDEVQPW